MIRRTPARRVSTPVPAARRTVLLVLGLFLLAVLCPGAAGAASSTDRVFGKTVAQSGTAWLDLPYCTGNPNCDNGCSCTTSNSTRNATHANREWLQVTGFSDFPERVDNLECYVRRVTFNLDMMYGSGTSCTVDVRVVVRDDAGTTQLDRTETVTFANSSSCAYRVPGSASDITSWYDWNSDPSALGRTEIWVRRGSATPTSVLYISGVYLSADTEDLPALAVSPAALDFGRPFSGCAVDRAFTLRNTGGGQVAGTIDTAGCADNFMYALTPIEYDLGPGQSQVVTFRYVRPDFDEGGNPDESDLTFPDLEGGYWADADGLMVGASLTGATVDQFVAQGLPAWDNGVSRLEFGGVSLGTSRDSSFTLRNSGCIPVQLDIADTCDPDGIFRVVAGAGAYALQPGESRVVRVRYTPDVATPDQCELGLDADHSVQLRGSGMEGTCQLSATDLDFGDVRVGESAERSFTITNNGTGEVAGCDSLVAPVASLGLSITAGGGAYVLLAHQSRTVTVRVAPICEAPASYFGTVDPGGGCSLVALRFNAQVGVDRSGPPLASGLLLLAPNPMVRATQLRYAVATRSAVEAKVFDAAGRRVRVLIDRGDEPGTWQVAWDGLDDSGRRVGPGMYLLRLTIGSSRWTRRVLVIS